MEVVQQYNQTRFMEFAPKIRSNADEWWFIEATLTGTTNHSSAYIALKLREYFYGKEGVVFICNMRNVLVLAHMGQNISSESLSKGIHEKIPQHSCTVQAAGVTPDDLIKIQLQLGAIEQANKLRPHVSALMTERQERQERIVMIVDDDMLVRSLVSKTFHTRSRVIEFKDTDKILEAYLEQIPDMVFLDIHLPGGSGIELLAEILRFDETAYVIILSSDSVKNNILNAKELGAKGFIAKPFTLEQLESCYKKCLTAISRRQ